MSEKIIVRLSHPQFNEQEERAVVAVLRSGNIAQGKLVSEFEKKFAQFVGVKYAVAVNNGTTALMAAVLALGIGKNDEVITTSFTFGATANCILAVGAKVKFVDIDPNTYCLDPNLVEQAITKRAKAIIGVDLFGQCADWVAIQKVARRYKLLTIEDAAQAHGAMLGNRKAGSFANVACFSFYATKNMTTGEGGMLTTDDRRIYDSLLLLRNHGMDRKYHYLTLGYNFRLTDIQAALGLVQLKKLEAFNAHRRANASYLASRLESIPGIIIPKIRPKAHHVFHQFVVRVEQPFPLTRDQIIKRFQEANIETAIHYPFPLHQLPLYVSQQKITLPVTEKVCRNVASLPVHPGLSQKDLERIVQVFRKAAKYGI